MSSDGTYTSEFLLLNGFYRYLGYTYVSRDLAKGSLQLVWRREGPYAAYVALTWVVIIGVFAYDASEAADMFDKSALLDKITSVLYSARTIIIQITSIVLAFTQAPKMVDVSTNLANLEDRLLFPYSLRGVARKLIVMNIAFTIVSIVAVFPLLYLYEDFTVRQLIWNSCYFVVCGIHGQTSCLLAYTWAMFFAETLASYLSAINAELKYILDSRGYAQTKRSFSEMHALFVRVMEAFELCEQILGKFLALIFPLNLVVTAPWGYWILREMREPQIGLLGALGFAGLFTQMLLVAIYPMRPYREAKKTWDVLTKLLVSQDHTPEIREQIASAIITYTVILYQSDNSSSSSAAAAAVTLNATKA
ncbi:hypothetical protein HPB48_005694 [Haemaphysalis longicornis]|uniref:Uncharacterized protein n=1 Tax=Haemaphysalis longicornis TaxID=44386 RepID=A0A9J6GQ76_HAELO|nr:hypothetical protein HPB48_005694 [Haemaphysalis longicornis]